MVIERKTGLVVLGSSPDPPALQDDPKIPSFAESHLPPTNVEGALDSLRPGNWLPPTAIELVLSKCSVPGIHMFHGISHAQPSPPQRYGKSNIILLPINHAHYWILAKVDKTLRVITGYGSASDALDLLTKQALLHFVATLDHKKSEWSFVAIYSPARENGYDCGVLLLITALYLSVLIPLPSSYQYNTSRNLFTNMLGGSGEAPAYPT